MTLSYIVSRRLGTQTCTPVTEALISFTLKEKAHEERHMTVIEIPDEQATALKAKAAAQGLTLKAWLEKLAEEAPAAPRKPLKTGRGMLAKYGPAPSAEEIDENRKELFSGFGENF